MSQNNEQLMQRRNAAVPRGVGQIHPIFVDRAENATVWDVEGREFIDFAGGIAVLNTGHLHPKIIAAVEAQLKKVTHTCFQVLAYEPYVELCEKINAKVPGDFAKKTLLVTTGAEAVENAVKVARAATGREGVIAFTGGYHGRTMATLALTGKKVPYSAGMGLMPGPVFRAQYPCELHGVSEDEAMASIARIFKNDAEPCDIAAIILEPVQGEGGFYVASPSFFKRLRALCDEHGVLLIADEIATGFGRTGRLFACEHAGIAPDLLCLGKGLTGGYMTLAATLATDEVARTISSGSPGVFMHGPTFMANALACSVALASIELLLGQPWQARIGAIEAALAKGLAPCRALPQVKDVRVLGAIGVVELHRAVDMRTIPHSFVERGVWVRPFGRLVYVMPAYVMSAADLATLTAAITEVVAGLPPP